VTEVRDKKLCLNCGSDSVGPVMTGTMAPTQILAEVLTRAQDPDPAFSGRGSGKKLLTFSDSRRAAAQFAAQLDRAHKQHIQRAAIYQALGARPGEMGLDELATRVAKVLRSNSFYDTSPNNTFRAKALVFEEFTASFASRRRLEPLGLGSARLLFEEPPPKILVALVGSGAAASALTQLLLQFIQYDSAVTRPELMGPLRGFAGTRPEVHIALATGPKRWISPDAPLHQRRRSRQFNLATRVVGQDSADQLLKAVWDYAVTDGVIVGDGDRYQISSDRIEFLLPEQWYRCTSCRRVTPYTLPDGRGCPTRNCEGLLEDIADVIDRQDHFTRNIIEPIEYFRIEEHTAQLSAAEGRLIGRDFRDGKVNILSCSTTFELGVDIGTLQSVFMRNVPPSVANYRQRAGRAGRTRQGAAFLVTYCGPTPHDRVFFERPYDIITGQLAIPEFNLANQILATRHTNSVLLSSLWRFVSNRLGPREYVEDFLLTDDVNAMVTEWRAAADPLLHDEVARYAVMSEQAVTVKELKDRFCDTLGRERELVQSRLEQLFALVQTLGGAAMTNTLNEMQRLRRRRLIDYLSARAFLPSYAFPIYVVELQTPDDKVSLQRDLRVAISEYAPGNQVVANKRLFDSVAVVLKGPSAEAKVPYRDVWYCDLCQAAYESEPDACTCGATSPPRHAQYIVPDGFMSDMSKTTAETIAQARTRQTRISQHVLASGRPTESLSIGPLHIDKYENARFLFLNHGDPGEQFRLCLTCGRRIRGRATAHKTPYGRNCTGQICRCFLGHDLIGEALSLQIDDMDGFIVPDDQVFFQTLSYALVEGISRALSIERRDLGVNVRRITRGGKTRWEIMILDNVPGGAGYVAQIIRPGSLQTSLAEAVKITDCRNCPDSSTCYSCLRSIENQWLHDKMQRGPVKQFLEALCARIDNQARTYGVNIDTMFRAAGLEEAFISVPMMSGVVDERIHDIARHCSVTVLVGGTSNPGGAAEMDMWRHRWPSGVTVLALESDKALVGTKRSGEWRIISDINASDLLGGTIFEGRLSDGVSASTLRQHLLTSAKQLKSGEVRNGHIRELARGQQVTERELFGYLFEGVVDELSITDRYLYELRHERRLKAWFDLIRTSARIAIETTQRFDKAEQRNQLAMFDRLKANYAPKLSIKVRYFSDSDMHDRYVVLRGEHSAKIYIPKGLDFIDDGGRIAKDTSVTVVPL
jgi:hypothetical protein